MARRRRDYLQHNHLRVTDWAHWQIRFIKDAGYPHETIEARMMAGGAESRPTPGPRVPHVMMPEAIAITDRAIRQLPRDLHSTLEAHYLDGIKQSTRKVNEVLLWLDGQLRK